jgi:hypothetical protein
LSSDAEASARSDQFSEPVNKKVIDAYYKIIDQEFEHYGQEGVNDYQEKALDSIDSSFKKDILFFALLKAFPIDNEYKDIIHSFAGKRRGKYLLEINDNMRKDGLLLPDKHPNPEGHLYIAYELENYLIAHNLIPCGK